MSWTSDLRRKLDDEIAAFEMPAIRPVWRGECRLLVNKETGELIGWEGLNDDPERCPADLCEGCGSVNCRCAPCRCEECLTRNLIACKPAPARPRGPQLVLL